MSHNKNISKFLSLILRHKPETINLTLDQNGWANVNELLDKMSQSGKPLSFDKLKEIVGTNNKKRFTFNEDLTKIRANQGHSIDVDVELEEKEPPEYLYHGTAARFLESIKEKGLINMNRQYVHLSSDEETAVMVGKRHGKPVALRIKAGDMYKNGIQFYLSKNHVWLTKKVDVQFIEF